MKVKNSFKKQKQEHEKVMEELNSHVQNIEANQQLTKQMIDNNIKDYRVDWTNPYQNTDITIPHSSNVTWPTSETEVSKQLEHALEKTLKKKLITLEQILSEWKTYKEMVEEINGSNV